MTLYPETIQETVCEWDQVSIVSLSFVYESMVWESSAGSTKWQQQGQQDVPLG